MLIFKISADFNQQSDRNSFFLMKIGGGTVSQIKAGFFIQNIPCKFQANKPIKKSIECIEGKTSMPLEESRKIDIITDSVSWFITWA